MIFVLVGTLLGFAGAVAAYAFYDASILMALAIWALSGPASVIVSVLASSDLRSGGAAPSDRAASKPHPAAETA